METLVFQENELTFSCGKIAHPTKESAKDHAASLRFATGQHVPPYKCRCGYWHVGHRPRRWRKK